MKRTHVEKQFWMLVRKRGRKQYVTELVEFRNSKEMTMYHSHLNERERTHHEYYTILEDSDLE